MSFEKDHTSYTNRTGNMLKFGLKIRFFFSVYVQCTTKEVELIITIFRNQLGKQGLILRREVNDYFAEITSVQFVVSNK